MKNKLSVNELNYYIKELSDITEINSAGGARLTGANISKANDIVEVIFNNTNLEEKIGKLTFSRVAVSEVLKLKIMEKIKPKNRISWRSFHKELFNYLKTKPVKKHYFIFPINIRPPIQNSSQKNFEIGGTKIKLLKMSEFSKSRFYQKEAIDELEKRYPNSLNRLSYPYALIEYSARDQNYALHQVYDKLHKFHAVINLTLFFGKRAIHLAPAIQATSEIKTTPYGLAYNEKKKFVNYVYSDTIGFEKIRNIDRNQLKAILRVYKILKRLPEEVKAILLSGLSKYQEAISTKFKEEAFTKYWTGLEILTLKTWKINHTKMLERFHKLTGITDTLFTQRLEDCRDKRNALLHEDYCNINDTDIACVKRALEFIIQVLVNTDKPIKSKRRLENILRNGW